MIARRIRARGRVQGVGFRWSTKQQANALGVSGWVRNTADGDVEALLVGDAGAVDALVSWLRNGPRAARVDELVVDDADPADRPSGFSIGG